ncbi:MAG: hypothetical protein CO030_02415 [Candidatus Magasanikbacteria bacterium CG_4_9_14_0_2_um_filter_42_11]|uniref:Uncharacterized protein n=1 Tax=Candidatus Magasanikbacteria bacterium CG_4_9_14_0_2_um_filter_42_11 TaxID=1974643 RepID=A0A2M8F9W5_9BACT|nr:MAG: hypothetical protein COU34_04500 [Candidatus Magasanikbacteria bacterium CG10_big_fil_rev_8_21_14_0_10_43_9]PIY92625.1 MAG: hypothetical protein COY70_02240 [Candidatus Magasanikbacteria bacterium CG_4_10_14_0_8_um_filter_42_12]PJC52530.1 MAG: hypothetical protein CO030_02415 [Candidatus Magasanikbacteria bacterium CG_4_9_14_0_2_um_filter_42_11]
MRRYWFKRKLFGWGWQPATWEGWLVLVAYIVIALGNLFFRYAGSVSEDAQSIYRFLFDTIILTIILILITVRTGEKPRWQWGKRIEDEQDTDPTAPR